MITESRDLWQWRPEHHIVTASACHPSGAVFAICVIRSEAEVHVAVLRQFYAQNAITVWWFYEFCIDPHTVSDFHFYLLSVETKETKKPNFLYNLFNNYFFIYFWYPLVSKVT